MVGKTTPKTTPAASSHKPSRAAQQQAAASSSAASLAQSTRDRDQQRLLNIFSDAFSNVLSSERFPTLLQEIKQALFDRDFAAAFGREDYLEAYAARWSPTRALCYATVFQNVGEYMSEMLSPDHEPAVADTVAHDEEEQGLPRERLDATSRGGHLSSSKKLRMLSIGGCAAEHVAFASYIRDTSCQGTLTLLDSAPWMHVASILQNQLTTAPPLSQYASAAAKASNRPLLPDSQLSVTFSQDDVLSLQKDKLAELVGVEPLVVTLLFTLNELYTEGGIGKTTKFLRLLGEVLPQGSLLLVVGQPWKLFGGGSGQGEEEVPHAVAAQPYSPRDGDPGTYLGEARVARLRLVPAAGRTVLSHTAREHAIPDAHVQGTQNLADLRRRKEKRK